MATETPPLLHRGVVHPWLCDAMGHLTTRHYMALFDDASLHLLAEATGWQADSAEWKNKGWADVHHEINYENELQVGALLEITGGITTLGNSSLTACYTMRHNSTQAISATMTAKTVFFDLVARCSIPLTEAMRNQIKGYLL